jgi:hypothetical protein
MLRFSGALEGDCCLPCACAALATLAQKTVDDHGAVDGFIGGAIFAWVYNHLGAASQEQSILLKTAAKT